MLEQEIRSDIDERQQLMLQIGTLYSRYGFNEGDEQLFLIYSIPTIYAIWEGFVDMAFRTYIQELNKLRLTVDTVCKPILIHHLESKFKQLKEYPKNSDRKLILFNSLNKFYTERLIEINTIVNTKSNVKFDVLNEILETFNLEKIPEYLEPRNSLKQKLDNMVIARNAVAHGQYIDKNEKIKQEDLKSRQKDLENNIKLVNILMDLVLKKIIEGFEKKSYLLIP
jgi:hypothetical protein